MRDLTRQLETRLQDFNKEEAGFEPRSGRAAVAMMVREGIEATEMLMIRRATREGARMIPEAPSPWVASTQAVAPARA